MQQRVNDHEETVIKRSETLENARFSNTCFYTRRPILERTSI